MCPPVRAWGGVGIFGGGGGRWVGCGQLGKEAHERGQLGAQAGLHGELGAGEGLRELGTEEPQPPGAHALP